MSRVEFWSKKYVKESHWEAVLKSKKVRSLFQRDVPVRCCGYLSA